MSSTPPGLTEPAVAGGDPGALTAEEDAALATTPADELVTHSMLGPTR